MTGFYDEFFNSGHNKLIGKGATAFGNGTNNYYLCFLWAIY